MRFLRNAFIAFGLSASFWLPAVAHAAETSTSAGYSSILSQGLIFGNICSGADQPCECRDSGKCQLSDMMQIFVNISIAILAICGSVALVMFIYGGVVWVTSMGNPKRIEQGKDILVHAVIGLAIIFGAYAFVNFLIAAISGKAPGATIEDTIGSLETSSSSGASCAQILTACGNGCVSNRDSCVTSCGSDTACQDACNETHNTCLTSCADGLADCSQ